MYIWVVRVALYWSDCSSDCSIWLFTLNWTPYVI